MVSADWRSEKLGSVATLQRGFDLPYRLRKPGTVPIVTSSGIEDRHCEAKVKAPGVVTGRYGTIGEVFFVREDFWPHNTTLYVRDFHGNDPLFISYLLRTIDFHTHSGKSGVPGVNRNDLHEIVVTLPSAKAEQEAIARALNDADTFIECLEQLIAKKRQIKQGAVQELVTGKRRLTGFSGDWKLKRLGEISEIAMGRTPPRLNPEYWGRGHTWLSIADLRAKVVTDSKEEITPLAAAGMQVIPKGTLLMSFKLSIGRLCFAGCDLYTNEAICSFNKLRANADFLYYVLGRTNFSLYGKQAVKGYTLNSESLKLVEVYLPPEAEQTAIAAILTDMDAEIAALEARLEKTRQLKQGMMQELLTGRARLQVDRVSVAV